MIKKIRPKECKYIEDSRFPLLVLAVHEKYSFKDKRSWEAIAHQTAGHGCHQHYVIGSILHPKVKVGSKIQQIADYWLDTDCGIWGVSLEKILQYRNQLKQLLNVDCNNSYRAFEEGIYPIDCSPKVLRKLTLDDIPDDLDELINWRKHERILGSIGRWRLYILGQNCD